MALNSCSSYEQASLIGELCQGWDLAKQLKVHMGPEISGQTKGVLLEGVLSSYEKSLMILKWGGSMEQSQSQSQQHVVPSTNMPESPISVIGSPKSEDLNPSFNTQPDSRDFSRKRKMMSSWTEKVSSENGLEGPPDDGHSWRKYGQKDILGAKHPRSYYRCTYRNMQGCSAIKQVQRNDEDPSVFDITYKGTHTCTSAPRSKSVPALPKLQEQRRQSSLPNLEYQQQHNVMLNFDAGLSVDVQNLENQEIGYPFSSSGYGNENHPFTPSTLIDNSLYGGFTPPYVSPATSGSNYFSTSPCKMSAFGGVHYGQHYSESDITEIISATTSATNSPIIGIDFPVDQIEFNPSHSITKLSVQASLKQRNSHHLGVN